MTRPRNVLIVSYFFPPAGGAGTQRAAKFAKYLPEFGWSPIVLTHPPEETQYEWNPNDASLVDDVGEHATVRRVSALKNPSGWARNIPRIDIAQNWLEPALDEAESIVSSHRVEAVLITMSPFDLCFLGREMKKRLGLPVVYDLRDPWALDGVRLHGSKARWKIDLDAMVSTLSHADGVIANTPEAARAIRNAVPTLGDGDVRTIPNGFDAQDFANAPKMHTCSARADSFCLTHAGGFASGALYLYGGALGWLKRLRHFRAEPLDQSGRTPLHLLRAIALLRKQKHPLGSVLHLRLIGRSEAATKRCIAESGVEDAVEQVGYLPHRDAVATLWRADALFLHLHGLPPGRRSLIVPGKTYEYLASGRPILGCLPEGDSRDMVERSGRGYCANPCDPKEIAATLVRMYEDIQGGTWQKQVDQSWLAAYERKALTGRLARFLEQVCARGYGSNERSVNQLEERFK